MNKRPHSLGFGTAIALTGLLFVACGGSDSVQGPDNQDDGEQRSAPWIDFSAISGDWAGNMDVNNRDFPLEVTLYDSARVHRVVGTAVYYYADGTHHCTVDLTAEEADPPAYVVQELLVSGDEGCEEGFGMLDHDADAGVLRYEFRTERNQSTGFVADLTRDGS